MIGPHVAATKSANTQLVRSTNQRSAGRGIPPEVHVCGCAQAFGDEELTKATQTTHIRNLEVSLLRFAEYTYTIHVRYIHLIIIYNLLFRRSSPFVFILCRFRFVFINNPYVGNR